MLKKILYIEDDLDLLEVVKFLFDEARIECVSHQQGVGSVEKALETKPDLILLDMNLPDMKGEEVYAKLKEHAQIAPIPIIILTGKASPNELAALKKMEPRGIITKPFDPLTFIKVVEGLYKS